MARRRPFRDTPPVSLEPEEILRRRAAKAAGKGHHRKAALALRELASLTGEARWYVQLGVMWSRARRIREAVDALRQGLYLHRRAGARKRAKTVARLIVAIDPHDAKARALAAA